MPNDLDMSIPPIFNVKPTILKVIILRKLFNKSDNIIKNNLKLIFIGDVHNNIKSICKKLESGIKLTLKEESMLDDSIPFFSKKMGDLASYDVKFVYTTINSTVNNRHFQIFLLDILYGLKIITVLDELKHGLSLYAFPRITDIEYNFKFIDYLFFVMDKDIIGTASGAEIVFNIIKYKLISAPLLSEWDIYKNENGSKSSDGLLELDMWLLKKIDLLPDVEYEKYQLVDKALFIKHIIQGLPYLFTSIKHTTQDKKYIQNFEAVPFFLPDNESIKTTKTYNNILSHTIKHTFHNNDIFVNKDNTHYDTILNYNELSTNNTLYCYLNSDILKHVKMVEYANNKAYNPFNIYIKGFMNKHKFNNLDEWEQLILNNRRNFTYYQSSDCINEYTYNLLESYSANKFLTANDRDWLIKSPVLFTKDISYNNIIIDNYVPAFGLNINLLSLFQDIKTSNFFPMVKLIKGGAVQFYNIYKPFFRNINQNTVKYYLSSTIDIIQSRQIEKFKSLVYQDYLLIFRKLDSNIIVKLYLFESGYLILEYTNNANKVSYNEIPAYLNAIDIIYHKIRKQYKIRNLNIPNYEKLFKLTPAVISRCHIIPQIEQTNTFKLDTKTCYLWYKINKDIIKQNKPIFPNLYLKVVGNNELSMRDFINNGMYESEIFNYFVSDKFNLFSKINTALEKINNIIVIPYNIQNKLIFYNKDTDYFYSKENIKYFILNKLQENRKYRKSDKQKLINIVKLIFNITTPECESLINEFIDSEEKVDITFKYIIKLSLTINKNTNEFKLQLFNFNTYNQVVRLTSLLLDIIKDCIFNSKFINNQRAILIQADNTNPLETGNNGILTILNSDLTFVPDDYLDIVSSQPVNKYGEATANILDKKSAENLLSNVDLSGLQMEDIDLHNLDDLNNLDISDIEKLDINQINITDMLGDIELDIDIDMIDNLIELDKQQDAKAIGNKQQDTIGEKLDVQRELVDIKVKQGIGKKSTIKLTDYMKNMRLQFDKDLYEPDIKGSNNQYVYDRICPSTKSRHPFIVTKEQLDTFKPGSITGYMKYRNNYYVCPRIWDASVNKPISIDDFLSNGMKSPYTGGLPISMNPKPNVINDKYNVIIRKPTTAEYWEIKNKHPDWPDILKKTEKEAFPALSTGNKHPKNLCVPCCFKNLPSDYDPRKENIIQNFTKPYNYKKCNYKQGNELYDTKKSTVQSFCVTSEYISNATTILKNCRLGLLPDTLDTLLNNGQSIFLNKTETAIIDNSNLFLRRGIVKDKIYNIFDTIANVLEKRTTELIHLCIRELSPIDFIKMNNGGMIDIFRKLEDYPITKLDIEKFIGFLNMYNSIFKYYDITLIEIDDVIANINKPEFVLPIFKGDEKNNYIIVKIIYRVYTSYYNYLSYLASEKEVKNYEYVLPIFTTARKWIPSLPDGLNIVIFDKYGKQFTCLNTFNNKSLKCLFLIQEEQNYFVPIVHVISSFNKLNVYGIITLDTKLNLSVYQKNKLSKLKPNYIKYIDKIEDRLSNVIKILYIQSNLCNYNLALFFKKVRSDLYNSKINITHQYLDFNDNNQIAYIKLNNKIYIPIYSHNNISDGVIRTNLDLYRDIFNDKYSIYTFFNLVYVFKIPDVIEEFKEKGFISAKDEESTYHTVLVSSYLYYIDHIYINKINGQYYIVGIKFKNKLTLPLYPVKYDKKLFDDIKTIFIKYKLTLFTIQYDNIFFNPLKHYIDIKINNINTNTTTNTNNILNKFNRIENGYLQFNAFIELFTVIFKNLFSKYIYNNKKEKDVIKFINIIKSYKEVNTDNLILYKSLLKICDKLVVIKKGTIKDIITSLYTKYNNKLISTLYTIIDIKCSKTVNTDFYLFSEDDKTCKLKLNNDLYSIIFSNLVHALLYDIYEYNSIMDGKYYIPISEISLIKRNMNLYYNLYEKEYNSNILLDKDEMEYFIKDSIIKENLVSKYKKQFAFEKNDSIDLSLDSNDISILKDIIIPELQGKIIDNLSSLFSKIDSTEFSSIKVKGIKTTVFNSEGFYNPKAQYNMCLFPFRNKKGKITNKCTSANNIYNKGELAQNYLMDNDLICPTEINKQRKVSKFGYCPENPNISNELTKMKLQDVYQYTDDKTLKNIGTCMFPFIYYNSTVVNPLSRLKPLIKVNFNCENEHDLLNKGNWCYAKPDSNDTPITNIDSINNLILIGAKKKEDIYKGEWQMDFAIKDGSIDTKAITNFYSLLEKGQCDIPTDKDEQTKIEKALELDNVVNLSLSDYNPSYCILPESKKGYTKKQLYIFGRDILNINYKILLTKNNKINQKNELCKLFNDKIRTLKKLESAQQLESGDNIIYNKNPLQCIESPTKGGYGLNELRDMGISYFGITEDDANKMNKQQLCDAIIPQVLKGRELIKMDTTSIYPSNKNIELCNLSEKMGGINKIKLNDIVRKYFNTDTKGKSKTDLCKIVSDGIKKLTSSTIPNNTTTIPNNDVIQETNMKTTNSIKKLIISKRNNNISSEYKLNMDNISNLDTKMQDIL